MHELHNMSILLILYWKSFNVYIYGTNLLYSIFSMHMQKEWNWVYGHMWLMIKIYIPIYLSTFLSTCPISISIAKCSLDVEYWFQNIKPLLRPVWGYARENKKIQKKYEKYPLRWGEGREGYILFSLKIYFILSFSTLKFKFNLFLVYDPHWNKNFKKT